MKPGILFPILFLFLSCSEQKDKHLGLQPYGSFPTAYADSISKTLTDIYGFKVSILSSKDIPSSTFINVKSPRYRADKLLKILKKNKSDSLQYLMGLLEKDICSRLWHGRRVWHCDVLSIWHQLGDLFGQSRASGWPAHGLRSVVSVLP